MKVYIHLCAVTLVLAAMLPRPALSQSGGSMELTITLRAGRATVLEAAPRESIEAPSPVASELRRLGKELEEKYDRDAAEEILSRLRSQTLVVSTDGPLRSVYHSSPRLSELHCHRRKCESL